MANNRLVMAGLNEWKAAMLKLPTHLAEEGRDIVIGAADEAASEIVRTYPARTGNLKKGVKVSRVSNPFGTRAIVKNTAKHAVIFEMGTQARHTELGANRGTMPPGHVFVPIVIRKRREMQGRLIAMMQREGLVVSGA